MEKKAWMAILLAAALCCGCRPVEPGAMPAEEYLKKREPVDELVKMDAATLADGTTLVLWHDGIFYPEEGELYENEDDIYKLDDGTTLLRVSPPYISTAEQEGFDNLSETAQAAIRAYYEERGRLYDLQEELECAYAIYRDCMDAGEEFFPCRIEQYTSPVSSNGRVIYFQTDTTYPTGTGLHDAIYSGEAFDRETGEKIDNMDLFCLPEKETLQRILDKEKHTQALRAETGAAIKPESLVFFPESVQIHFPEGSLPSVEDKLVLAVAYRDLDGVIYDWAVPEVK